MAKENNIKALCLRFDLADEEERQAYNHLQDRDKTEFGSYTKIVSRAVNEFYERRSRLKDDPYFETREKEDAFIARVLDAVRHSAPSLPVSQEAERRNKRRTWRQCALFLTALNDSKNAAFAITKTKINLKYDIKNTKFYITEET